MQQISVVNQTEIDAAIAAYDTAVVQPLVARVAKLEAGSSPPPTTGTDVSGASITTDIPAGWRETISETFDLPVADKAAFDAQYLARRITRYPDNYPDTRTKQGKTDGGYYNAPISVSGGILRIPMDVVNGKARVAAIVPKIGTVGTWGDTPGAIAEHRSRFTYDDGFKSAHLFWPYSNTSNPDGEIDYPEFNGPGGPVKAFLHYQNPTFSGEQKEFVTAIDPRQWHTYRTVWKMGQYVEFYCDGVLIAPRWTTRVPSTPMHCVLQNETKIGTGSVGPAATAKGLVEMAWIRGLVPA